MDYHGDMLNSRTGYEGEFKRQPAMNIQRAVYNGGLYDAPKRHLDAPISTSRVPIVKRDRGPYTPQHALYEHSRSPKRRRILPNNDSRGVDIPRSADESTVYSSRPDRYSPSMSAGQKRRASSPPVEDGHPQRESTLRISPVPRFHSTFGSVSSTASGPRSSSYASTLSVAASSITSMSSYRKLSPGGISPGSSDVSDTPYVTSLPGISWDQPDQSHISETVAKRLGLSKDKDGEVSLISLYSGGGKASTAKSVVRGSDDIQPPSEASAERSTREPEISYSLGDMVALKRKTPWSETDEQVPIPGRVVKIIGYGSNTQRYEVQALNSGQDNPGGNIYKASASSMSPFIAVEDIRRTFSLLSKVNSVSRYTISQDNTQGDDARNAALLAAFGKKIRCPV